MNFALPGSQWALGSLIVGALILGILTVGINVGKLFEYRKHGDAGDVENPWTCILASLFTMAFLLYALAPVVVGVLKWADKIVKGG